jgi:hypothetical protein
MPLNKDWREFLELLNSRGVDLAKENSRVS